MCTSISHDTSTAGDTPDKDWVARQIESNLAGYWLGLGRQANGSLYISDELSWEYSGGPYFNRVVDAHLSAETVDDRIDEIKRAFIHRGAAVTWLLGPSASPSDLGQHLRQQGFEHYESWAGMAHSLSDVGVPPDVPEKIRVREVRDHPTSRDWLSVVARSFGLPRPVRRLLRRSILSNKSVPGDDVWKHNLVYVDGRPAAASTLFVRDGVAGIYLVSTVPEMREMGLGSYATWLALRQAESMGCKLAVLQSTGQARPLYERLGFRYFCDIGVYRYEVPAPTWKRVTRSGLRRLRRSFQKATGRADRDLHLDPALAAEFRQDNSGLH